MKKKSPMLHNRFHEPHNRWHFTTQKPTHKWKHKRNNICILDKLAKKKDAKALKDSQLH